MEVLRSVGMVAHHTLLKQAIKTNKISTRNGVSLAHKIHGRKDTFKTPPIIVLHGLLGSSVSWDFTCKKIWTHTQRTVIAVDARNHGLSPHHNSHTYLELAEDVNQLMSKLFINEATIIGHCMGGRTAMVLALTQPQKVRSLIVVDISPLSSAGFLEDNFFPRLIDVMKTVRFKNVYNMASALNGAKYKLCKSGIIEDFSTLDLILKNVGKKRDKSLGWVCNVNTLKEYYPTITKFPIEVQTKTYPGPTLFIAGDKSCFIPPNDFNGIQNFFPQAQLAYVANVGHNLHIEDTDTFLSLVTFFLARAEFNKNKYLLFH